MNLLKRARHLVRTLFQTRASETAMAEEIRLHLELQTEANVRAGMSPDEAERAAKRRFGWRESVEERCRDERGGRWVRDLIEDLRFGARMLAKTPGFTATVVLILGIGIGACTAIFSAIQTAFFEPLPYKAAEEVFSVGFRARGFSGIATNLPTGTLELWQQHALSVGSMAGFRFQAGALSVNGQAEATGAMRVTAGLFDVLRIAPLRGRLFSPEDARPGMPSAVVVISSELWERRFGGSEEVVGSTVLWNGATVSIVGILPPKVLAPISMGRGLVLLDENGAAGRGRAQVQVLLRIRAGLKSERAEAELERIQKEFGPRSSNARYRAIALQPLSEKVAPGERAKVLFLLAGVVAAVLLVACANVAGLLLVRAARRRREIAIRSAVGGSRGRLARQLLAESVLLGLLGGALGLLIARAGVPFLNAPPESLKYVRGITGWGDVDLDGTVLAFACVLSLATGLAFGVVPALRLSRTGFDSDLKEGGLGFTSRGRHRFQSALLVAQIAVSLALIALAAGLLRGFQEIVAVPTGFDEKNALLVEVGLWGGKYGEPGAVAEYFEAATEHIAALPGVRHVGVTDGGPALASSIATVTLSAPEGEIKHSVRNENVSLGYLEAAGIRLLRGRQFQSGDASGETPSAIVIDAKFAQTAFPGSDPLGRQVKIGAQAKEVIGVAPKTVGAHTRAMWTSADQNGQIYQLVRTPNARSRLLVRTEGDAKRYLKTIRDELRGLDPTLAPARVIRLKEALAIDLGPNRLALGLAGGFAGVALGLAATGIFGMTAFIVAERRREMGIRLAVGAAPGGLVLLLMRKVTLLALFGVAAGLMLAALVNSVSGKQLPLAGETRFTDLVQAGVGLFVIVVAAAAFPALRARRLNPVEVLRND